MITSIVEYTQGDWVTYKVGFFLSRGSTQYYKFIFQVFGGDVFSTTASPLTLSTQVTWTSPRSRATLTLRPHALHFLSGLGGPLMGRVSWLHQGAEVGVENPMKKAKEILEHFLLTGMKERQQLVDDHNLFVSGDTNL